jgi:hypothetical protein
VKGYVRNKAHPDGSIAERYILEGCLTFYSRLFDVDTKDNHVDRHETVTVNESPSGLSIFSKMNYKRRGQTVEEIPPNEFRKMRHYIICNCDEAGPYVE